FEAWGCEGGFAVWTTCRCCGTAAQTCLKKGETMDPRAFDELSRQLARKTSRGQALKLFGGALVGTLVGARAAHANPPEKHCKFQGYNCGDNTDCCSLLCCNRTCCGSGQVCSGGMCTGGTSPPPPPPPPPPGGCTTAADCP